MSLVDLGAVDLVSEDFVYGLARGLDHADAVQIVGIGREANPELARLLLELVAIGRHNQGCPTVLNAEMSGLEFERRYGVTGERITDRCKTQDSLHLYCTGGWVLGGSADTMRGPAWLKAES